MSNPYDENPQNQPSDPNPYSQPTPNPYGQPDTEPVRPADAEPLRPAADPYGNHRPSTAARPPCAYGQPYGAAPQEHPQGTLILVFGIIGIFSGIFAPIAWYLGNKARREIAASGARYANESQINTGRMLGKVFTIIYIVIIVLYDHLHHHPRRRRSQPKPALMSSALGRAAGASRRGGRAGGELTALRRQLHRCAEIGLELPRTQAAVLAALADTELEISRGQRCSSVVGVLRGGGRAGGPAVLLRGDMDALPVTEETGEPFAAPPGAMHACGHDLHTAGLVGAAKLLSRHRDQLAGDVVFMFQPGEEGRTARAR